MATSGSYNWKLTRDQVITAALRKLAVLPSGTAPTAAQISDAADALNSVLKAFHADGMPLWAIINKTFTVTFGTSSYTIGISQTINAPPPLKIVQALYTVSGGNATLMNIYSMHDFNELPNTNNSATPVILSYQPLGESTSSSTGTIKLWPTPDNSTTTITVYYQRPFQDMDASSDDLDFPNYWTQAITYNLAWALAPEYGVPPTDRSILAKEAQYFHEMALSFGSEETSFFFQPDMQGR